MKTLIKTLLLGMFFVPAVWADNPYDTLDFFGHEYSPIYSQVWADEKETVRVFYDEAQSDDTENQRVSIFWSVILVAVDTEANFEFVTSSANADIVITSEFAGDDDTSCAGGRWRGCATKAGMGHVGTNHVFTGGACQVRANLSTISGAWNGLRVYQHEIGHCLGLGHLTGADEVMTQGLACTGTESGCRFNLEGAPTQIGRFIINFFN